MGLWTREPQSAHTVGYYPAVKNSEVLSFVVTQMEREDVVLSEVSQAQRDRWPLLSLLCADGNAGPPATEGGIKVTRCWGLRGRAGVVISESSVMGSRKISPGML